MKPIQHNDLIIDALVSRGIGAAAQKLADHLKETNETSDESRRLLAKRGDKKAELSPNDYDQYYKNDGLDELQRTHLEKYDASYLTSKIEYALSIDKSKKRFRFLSFVLQIAFVAIAGWGTLVLGASE